MRNFTNLESIYNHLEEKALDYDPYQIVDLFQKLSDFKKSEKELVEAEKAQWEVDFFHFVFLDSELKQKPIRTDDKGEVIKCPFLDRFNEKTYEYLMERLKTTSNPLLKACYSHILWSSPKKHAQYAKLAVDTYLELVGIYEKKDKELPNEHFGLDVLKNIKTAYFLSQKVNYRVDEIKSEIVRLVKNFNFESSSSFKLRFDLIELMLNGKRKFSKDDFRKIITICWKISKLLLKTGVNLGVIDMLELGERIDKRLGSSTDKWRKEIAKCYEIFMKKTERGDSGASISFCQDSLKSYKMIKDEKKIKELEKKYEELKKSRKFASFGGEIDLTEYIKKCKELAEEIAQKKPKEIINFLMVNKNILPKYKDMEKNAKEQSERFVFSSLIPGVIIDQNGHSAQYFSDENEKKYYNILWHYSFELKLNKICLINEIFFAAIKKGKLTIEIILEYLHKYSWLGKTLSRESSSDKKEEYNWISLIAPSLNEYFNQMQYCLSSGNNPNLVLCIDSLILKIEGLLRDLCQLSGKTTFRQKKDKKSRDIVQEKDIHALLYEETIKNLFDEDDLLFFKFLLVEKAGYNLRHRVAHSLLFFHEYSIEYMHLLILAVLKLGKYDFVKKADKKK